MLKNQVSNSRYTLSLDHTLCLICKFFGVNHTNWGMKIFGDYFGSHCMTWYQANFKMQILSLKEPWCVQQIHETSWSKKDFRRVSGKFKWPVIVKLLFLLEKRTTDILCLLAVYRPWKDCRMITWIIWASSSEFVSSSIPSWQISTAQVQPFRGARDLVFCLKVPLDSLLVWASSGGSGETARMRRLAWTFAARIGDKYQIRLTRSI